MRFRSTALLILCLALGALVGCGQDLTATGSDYSNAALSDQSATRLTEAVAKSTSALGQPPIAVESVRVEGAAASRTVDVSVNLEMAADSWDAAFRAAEFGALLIPAILEHPDVELVTIRFGQQGGPMVDYACSRAGCERTDWRSLRETLDRTDGASWPAFFQAVGAYEWRDDLTWQDVRSGGWPDSVESSQLPRAKP